MPLTIISILKLKRFVKRCAVYFKRVHYHYEEEDEEYIYSGFDCIGGCGNDVNKAGVFCSSSCSGQYYNF